MPTPAVQVDSLSLRYPLRQIGANVRTEIEFVPQIGTIPYHAEERISMETTAADLQSCNGLWCVRLINPRMKVYLGANVVASSFQVLCRSW